MTAPKRRVRHVIRSAIVLVLAAVANVLVAWILVAGAEVSANRQDVEHTGGLPTEWTEWLEDPGMTIRSTGSIYRGPGWRFTVFGIASPAGTLQRVGGGWPMIAFEGEARTVLQYQGRQAGAEIVETHRVVSTGVVSLVGVPFLDFLGAMLPIGPVWSGIAVNTLLYACALWLLLIGPGTVRRAFRVKRGRCARCGYPAGASSVCTECGGPLP